MTAVLDSPTVSAATVAATPQLAEKAAPKDVSVAKTLVRSALTGLVVVWIVSALLISRTPASAAESFAFGAMVGFWIGIGGGMIAGGAIMSARDEKALHA